MTEPTLNFSRAEYAERLAKTRRAMADKGVELLIVSDPSNMAWLTGYDGWSFYVHQAVLVPPEGEPVWFGRGQDANGAKRTAYLAHDNIVGYPDHYVQSTERHPMDYLSTVIAGRGWDRLSLGVEMDNYWFSAAAFASLQRNLPNARFVDATGAGQLAARRQEPAGARLDAQGRPHRRADACAHRGKGRARHAQMRPRRRDLRCRHSRHAGVRRRLSGHRAAAAVGRRRLGAASDLGRPADEERRGHLLRDRRLLPPLSSAAVAHAFPGQARPGLPRRREGDAGGHGGRAGRGAPGQHLRGHRQRLLRRAQALRHRQGQPHRLSDRHLLSAGLGRAHHEPQARATARSSGPA